MLVSLSIRNVVLIERLDLTFQDGLSVFTGETGAGKTILLDSLALALGQRADVSLIRKGQDSLCVIAEFEAKEGSALLAKLAENEIPCENKQIIIKRTVNKDGKSKAFINDEPVSIGFLKQIGDMAVEVHGQFAAIGLLDSETHIDTLDEYGGLISVRDKVAKAYSAWQDKERQLFTAKTKLEEAQKEQDYLHFVTDELIKLNPQVNEAATLENSRILMMNSSKISENLHKAYDSLAKGEGTEVSLNSALRSIERIISVLPDDDGFQSIFRLLDSAVIEVQEASSKISEIIQSINFDELSLQQIDDRLFALKDMARKHKITPDELPELLAKFQEKLDLLEGSDKEIGDLQADADKAKSDFLAKAKDLSLKRQNAALQLDKKVAAELPALKMDKAQFKTVVEELHLDNACEKGINKVFFTVSTNKGEDSGALGKIASGGELARFMLALKLVLAKTSPEAVLIFDEVDAGIGGATAAAVGKRLHTLANNAQVLVVTHSPQIAAVADNHFFVSKASKDKNTISTAVQIRGNIRTDEIARMLSGTHITEEARKAAASLMNAKE